MGQSNNNDDSKTVHRALHLDVDYYQAFLDDVDIPDDQKRELIAICWNIVVQFIDLRFGIHPLQQTKANDPASLELSKLINQFAEENVSTEKETEEKGADA